MVFLLIFASEVVPSASFIVVTDSHACGGHGSSYSEYLFRTLLAVISVYTPCSDREIHQSSMDNHMASNTETSDQPTLPSANTSSEKQTQSAEKKTASTRDDTASAVTKR